jgi:hypothetical protein
MKIIKKKSPSNKIIVTRPGVGGWTNPIPEPVIYPEQIIEACKQIGFKHIEIKEFSEYYDDFIKNNKHNKLSSGEKDISFLHKVFILGY